MGFDTVTMEVCLRSGSSRIMIDNIQSRYSKQPLILDLWADISMTLLFEMLIPFS